MVGVRGFEVLVMSEVERGARPVSLDRGDADWLGGYVRMGGNWGLKVCVEARWVFEREL